MWTFSRNTDRRFESRRIGLAAALTLGLAGLSAPGALADGFYDGKMIDWLVPASPGGGTDTAVRMMAPFLSKYLPTEPVVQVFNEPAGSAILGLNSYAKSEHDGTHIVMTSTSSTLPYLLKEPGVEYDLREFEAIAGLPLGGVVYVRGDSPYQKASDLFDAKAEIIYGGENALGGDSMPLLSFEVLGLKTRGIMGYDGAGASRMALEQGEVDIVYDNSASYLTKVKPLQDEGKVRPLYTFGFLEAGKIVRDPLFPDLPHVGELYSEKYGKDPSGPQWAAYQAEFPVRQILSKVVWVHNDAPAEAKAELHAAFAKLVDDEEFKKRKAADLGPYDILLGDNLTRAVELMLTVDEEATTWKKQWLTDKYGVKF